MRAVAESPRAGLVVRWCTGFVVRVSPGRPGWWPGHRAGQAGLACGPARLGEAGQGSFGEVAAGDGFEQVVYGAGELPFGGGFGLAAHGELAEAHVVLDLAVRGLGDVAAAGGRRRCRRGFASRAAMAAMASLCQGAPLLGSPDPRAAFSRSRVLPVAIRRSGPSMVRLCSDRYPASAEEQPDQAGAGRAAVGPGPGAWPASLRAGGLGGGRRGAVGGDERGGGLGLAQHRLEPGAVAGIVR